jgi:endonuclease/exonuclease/phosphatase family metal-dependent hydrolase
MKRKDFFYTIPFLCWGLLCCFPAVSQGSSENTSCLSVKVMSFNIRYDNPGDGENRWANRSNMVASMILFHDADLVGVQESLINQVHDLEKLLKGYAWTGVGRDDGKQMGEYSAIFYRSERVKLLDNGTYWLSQTPDHPGLGWDAACKRVVTWGLFEDLKTGKKFCHFNTHFDHMGDTARVESAHLLKARMASIAGELPVIVTGDFNCDDRSVPYQIMTAANPFPQLFDSHSVSLLPPYGPSSSWTGFETAGTEGSRIDFIFVSGSIKVIRNGILSDSWGTRFPSDHMPVFSEMIVH